MKKLLAVGAFAVLGVVALSSCRKDYNCVDTDGTVVSQCLKCKSKGVVYDSFKASCDSYGGTIEEQ